MSNESDMRRGRRCAFRSHVHLVFVAKYRRRVFDAQAIDVLRGIFVDVCSDVHATLVEMDGETTSRNLLVEYPAKLAVSSLANCLNGVFNRLLRQQRLIFASATGRACSGRPATSLPPAAERPPASCANTSSGRGPGTSFTTASPPAPSFPALKDGACRTSWSARPSKRGRPDPAIMGGSGSTLPPGYAHSCHQRQFRTTRRNPRLSPPLRSGSRSAFG
jgi:putative transposase